MSEMKRKALARLQKALEAHEKGLVTAGELSRIEFEVLNTPDVKSQNVKDLKEKFRGSLVKNA